MLEDLFHWRAAMISLKRARLIPLLVWDSIVPVRIPLKLLECLTSDSCFHLCLVEKQTGLRNEAFLGKCSFISSTTQQEALTYTIVHFSTLVLTSMAPFSTLVITSMAHFSTIVISSMAHFSTMVLTSMAHFSTIALTSIAHFATMVITSMAYFSTIFISSMAHFSAMVITSMAHF